VPLRTVETLPVHIPTSLGSIAGELWSDRLVGIGLDRADGTAVDCDGYVNSAGDLADLIASLGVPRAEAGEVAATFWNDAIAPVWAEWEQRESEPDAGKERGVWRRLGRLISTLREPDRQR
jgi:hypothetical protein